MSEYWLGIGNIDIALGFHLDEVVVVVVLVMMVGSWLWWCGVSYLFTSSSIKPFYFTDNVAKA